MNIINDKMLEVLLSASGKRCHLSRNLFRILEKGIAINKDCLVLNYFYAANPHIELNQFEDKTSYEYFINGFHVEDYCKSNTLSNTILFVKKLAKLMTDLKIPVYIIISCEKNDFFISLHSYHQNEKPLIETASIDCDYKEPILVHIVNNNSLNSRGFEVNPKVWTD